MDARDPQQAEIIPQSSNTARHLAQVHKTPKLFLVFSHLFSKLAGLFGVTGISLL